MGNGVVIKRGNELNMPLLAEGELGFALDTEKLYVGTGSRNVAIGNISTENFVTKGANGNVALTGNLTLKGTGNFGNKINFGDGDYVHISEPADDTLELKGTRIKLYTSSTEVMKLEGGKVYINGVEVSSGSITLDFDILCSSKGYSCATINSSSGCTETITKTTTSKKAALRTITMLSNGYRELITFYGEDGITVKETRTKTITKAGNEYTEVTV